LNERMNLEQNFKRLNPSTATKGKAAIAGILGTIGLAVTAFNIYNSPAGKAAINLGRKAIVK